MGELFLGIGAGAHSFERRSKLITTSKSKRYSNIPKPAHYLKRILEEENATQLDETLNQLQEQLEILYCFLRCAAGIPLIEFQAFFDFHLLDATEDTVARLG